MESSELLNVAFLTTDGRFMIHDYAATWPAFGTAPDALLQGFAMLPDEIRVHVLSCTQQPVQAPPKLAENIWFHSLHVPKIGWMRTGYYGCIRAVRKKVRELNPDIVHGQGTERDCAMSAVFSGYPNVVTIHGNMRAMAGYYSAWTGTFYWMAAKLEALALKRTMGVFCNSAYTEKLVAPCAKRLWRVPNALRQLFFEPSANFKTETRTVLLNVGEIFAHKRQVELLRVARNLHRRGFKFEMRFVGRINPQASYCKDFMREIAVAEKEGYARHLGTMGVSDLIKVMDESSALVHCPSEEAFGLVAAEALARNLKLFGFDVGGLKDIGSDVEGAELFPDKDWTGLENSIARWLEAGSPRPKTASQTMHSRYAPEIIARGHLEIYRSVLENNGKE